MCGAEQKNGSIHVHECGYVDPSAAPTKVCTNPKILGAKTDEKGRWKNKDNLIKAIDSNANN